LSEVQAASEAAFEELLATAVRVAYRLLSSGAEAEDLPQKAFLRLHRESRGGHEDRVA
jgi:DNA-directed RNA polymerase specialized sigma24 family protein